MSKNDCRCSSDFNAAKCRKNQLSVDKFLFSEWKLILYHFFIVHSPSPKPNDIEVGPVR